MSSTAIMSGSALSLNILSLYSRPNYTLTAGSYKLGTLKFSQTDPGACLNLTFLNTSVIFDSLTQLTYSTKWTFTNPTPCINVGIHSVATEVPGSYTLFQNYPNPFNPTTNIRFALTKQSNVTLKIYDNLGKEIATLVNEVKSAGTYIVDFNASNYASGIYFYKLTTNEFSDVKKMVLIK